LGVLHQPLPAVFCVSCITAILHAYMFHHSVVHSAVTHGLDPQTRP
jgi:hypothetical protein